MVVLNFTGPIYFVSNEWIFCLQKFGFQLLLFHPIIYLKFISKVVQSLNVFTRVENQICPPGLVFYLSTGHQSGKLFSFVKVEWKAIARPPLQHEKHFQFELQFPSYCCVSLPAICHTVTAISKENCPLEQSSKRRFPKITGRIHNHGEGPYSILNTRAFSWLKESTSTFTFKTLLRHYAKRA